MVLENGLTIGEVAGLISGVISLLHIAIPLVWGFLLVAVIRGQEFDAATWSSISHLLQSSWWPSLLQSDGAVGNFFGKVIQWRVFFLSQCVTFATICLIVANFLTPKPLVETVKATNDAKDAEFVYAPDMSYYGQAMLAPQKIHRVCGWTQYKNCPNSTFNDPTVQTQYRNVTIINSTVPDITQETFSSGSQRGTIAGPLDIQYRAYIMNNLIPIDNNASRPMGRLENLPKLILDEGYHLVEGLVVDTIHGGIGLRNHTIPIGLELGGIWTEDILWISPETRCTNTNLSLHFTVTNNASVSYGGDLGFLQDDGGFWNIPAHVPSPRWDTNDSAWRNVGPVPDLKGSVDILAWWSNQATAWAMNLTESKPGSVYRGHFDNYAHMSATGAIKISPIDGMFLDDLVYKRRLDLATAFYQYSGKCTGYWDDDPSTAGKAFVKCGYFYDVPTPENSATGQSWRVDPGSGWKQNLYTCASAVSVSVKEVTFSMNGTSTLDNLHVMDIRAKNYSSQDLPTWGIEKVDPGKYQVWDVYKFWGLIDAAFANASNVDVYRSPQIYLPAAVRGKTMATKMWDNFAGGGLFSAAWHSIYENAAIQDSIAEVGIPNYSGKLDYGLTLKWRQLCQQGNMGVEHILNLIWTDLVSFAVAGSRTGFEDSSKGTSAGYKHPTALGIRKVRRYVRVIEYEDIRYAIPAFIVAGLFVIPLIACLLLLCLQRKSWRALNHYLNQTSMGRTSTRLMFRDKRDGIDSYAKTRDWARVAQYVMLDVPPVSSTSSRMDGRTGRLSNRRPYSRVDNVDDSQETITELRMVSVMGGNRNAYEPGGLR